MSLLLLAVGAASHAAPPIAPPAAAPLASVAPHTAVTALPAHALPPQLQAQLQPTPPPPQTYLAAHWPWMTHGVAGLFVISAIALVLLLAVQTTKQEGLTGSIGGRVESTYRGRLGGEEILKRWTGFTAVIFVVTAFVLSLTGI